MIGRTNAQNYNEYQFVKELPSEYQILEYLESDGQAYIDTLISSHSNMSAELLFEFVEQPNDCSVIGTKYSKGSRDRLYFYHHYQGHKLGYGDYVGSGNVTVGERYLVKTTLNVGNQSMYVNNTLIYQGYNNTYLNTRLNFYVFNLNTDGLEDGKYGSKIKLYYLKIWDGNKMVRDYVPVIRLEDEELGLYDMINQQFYTNQGSGSFIKTN